MDGLTSRLSNAVRAALAHARALLLRTAGRAGMPHAGKASAGSPRRTGFLRGYTIPDDFDRMAADEIQAMFEGRQPER